MKDHHFFPLMRDYTSITVGVVLQALSMVLFYIPGNLAAGGVSGIAQLIGNFTGWPIGTLYIVLESCRCWCWAGSIWAGGAF